MHVSVRDRAKAAGDAFALANHTVDQYATLVTSHAQLLTLNAMLIDVTLGRRPLSADDRHALEHESAKMAALQESIPRLQSGAVALRAKVAAMRHALGLT